MRTRSLLWLAPLLGAVLIAGCRDDHVTAPRFAKPAAPRGLVSVTGDHQVFLNWLANTESGIAGYRIYMGDCAGGTSCPYDRVGTTSDTHFTVSGLADGVTKYFAVSAVGPDGQESDLSYDNIFDTPRPEGTGLVLANVRTDSTHAGYDFSDFRVRSFSDPLVDIYYGTTNGTALMIAPFTDTQVQDAGYATSLDAVDFAPTAGWSPSGTVELITGHCYVVWTGDNHYAKFRVTSLSASQVVVDWAYQVDTGNRELKSQPGAERRAPRVRRASV